VNKVLKLHLVYHKIEDGEQVQIFNGKYACFTPFLPSFFRFRCSFIEFAMFSQTSGRVFAAVSGFVVPYILMAFAPQFTFKALKFGLIAICFIFDIVSFFCAYLIPTDFIPGSKSMLAAMEGGANGEKGREASVDVYDDGDIGLTSLLDSQSDVDDRNPTKSTV
jgi:hypothetical protein